MKILTNYLFECDSTVERHEGKSVTYISMGEGLKDRSYVADGTESITTSDYLVLDYCLSGAKRLAQKRQSIISGVCGTEEQGLLFLNEMIADGQKHRLIMPCERNTYDFLRLNLQSRSPKLKFEIYSFYTCTYEELPKRFESCTYEGDYACIDIEALCNARVSTEPGMIDSGVTIPVGKVGVQGIPFCFPQDNRMFRPDAGPIEENEEIIKNFTATVKRGLCRPVSRASRITVPVDRKASEIYFVLYMDGKIYERIDYCAPDTTILGQARDEVFKPICVNDIERFAILVEYEDGMIDECFPQNVKTGRHEIMGETGVYGVPLHNKKVVSISFETRMRETDISLLEETKGREFMAHSYRIKKHYADCFSSDEPETMIEGVSDAICINRFPGIGRTVYTLYNRSYHTYQGDVLCVPYREGAEYRDVWNDKEVDVTVKDGYAYISTTITAQAVGAIVEIIE